ncbi:MAG: hypothetical protein CMJ37_03705 [Phycisphaerae bacterium]|nr:hypothetical protein [Phycisphaerae bacterium]
MNKTYGTVHEKTGFTLKPAEYLVIHRWASAHHECFFNPIKLRPRFTGDDCLIFPANLPTVSILGSIEVWKGPGHMTTVGD